jgi:uncharacterized protein (TIGR03382 family)
VTFDELFASSELTAVTINVTAVNRTPVAIDQLVAMDEDEEVVLQLEGDDLDEEINEDAPSDGSDDTDADSDVETDASEDVLSDAEDDVDEDAVFDTDTSVGAGSDAVTEDDGDGDGAAEEVPQIGGGGGISNCATGSPVGVPLWLMVGALAWLAARRRTAGLAN